LIENKVVNEGELLEFTTTASDQDGDTLTYFASSLPVGASFDPNTKIFTWTPADGQAGSYQVQFKVTDGASIDVEDIVITVDPATTPTLTPIVNSPPVLDFIGDKSVNVRSQLVLIITASDPDGDLLTYSASDLPIGASFDPATCTFEWKPQNKQVGSHQVRFNVSDGLSIDSEYITITVNKS
jgi:hypothetical protein